MIVVSLLQLLCTVFHRRPFVLFMVILFSLLIFPANAATAEDANEKLRAHNHHPWVNLWTKIAQDRQAVEETNRFVKKKAYDQEEKEDKKLFFPGTDLFRFPGSPGRGRSRTKKRNSNKRRNSNNGGFSVNGFSNNGGVNGLSITGTTKQTTDRTQDNEEQKRIKENLAALKEKYEYHPSKAELERVNGLATDREKKKEYLRGSGNDVSKEEEVQNHLAKILQEYIPPSQTDDVQAAINNPTFKDAQLDVENDPNNDALVAVLEKEILDVIAKYKPAIEAKSPRTDADFDKLKSIVKKGSRDTLVLYESVNLMIVNTEEKGCLLYLHAIQIFIFPDQEIRQTTNQLAILFQNAAQVSERFKNFVDMIQIETNQEAKLPKHLKKMARMIEKSIFKRPDDVGNANEIRDIVRGMMKCINMGKVAEVVALLASHDAIVVTRVKDRFFSSPSAGGWRDCMVNFYFKDDPNRHICELQIAHSLLITAREEYPGHLAYGKVRNAMEYLLRQAYFNKLNNADGDDEIVEDIDDDDDDDSSSTSTGHNFKAMVRFQGGKVQAETGAVNHEEVSLLDQKLQTAAVVAENDGQPFKAETGAVNVEEVSFLELQTAVVVSENECQPGLEYQSSKKDDPSEFTNVLLKNFPTVDSSNEELKLKEAFKEIAPKPTVDLNLGADGSFLGFVMFDTHANALIGIEAVKKLDGSIFVDRARCQKPTCGEKINAAECTACTFPRPVRDMGSFTCRRKELNDCQNEASTVVSSNEECWQFNKAWKEGKDQVIRIPEDGETIRSGECLDEYGRNYAKNNIDHVLQKCTTNQVGHVGVWGRQFEDVCSMYTGGKITYNEAAKVAQEIYAVNKAVPSEVLGGKMKNQRFSLRNGVGWDAASELIGTELTEKIGWMAEAGQMSIDPTVVSGFNETLLYWKKSNDLAFRYALPKSCEKCMGLDANGDPTPWTKLSKCTHVEENRCKCNGEDDPEHLCPHYLETGDNPLDVYVTLVKIAFTPGDDESGMFEYNEDCKNIYKFYNKELCTEGLVPKPLLEYGYFPVPIPRFKVPTADGLATFLCPWPLWVSNLLPNGAKLDEKLKLTKENFGRR